MNGESLEFERPLVELERRIEELKKFSSSENYNLTDQITELEKRAENIKKQIFSNLSPWQRVQLSRHPSRPYSLDYVQRIFSDFVELHGDRLFGEDRSIVCGLGNLENETVFLVGQQKGKNTKENLSRNFGMPNPEGYRKSLRIFNLAKKFSKPVITLIDTPGAYPGIGAEERGIAESIAKNLMELSKLPVPVIAVIIGEGGSGGALGIGVGDRILMMENSTYSVITPEGCAAILWSDRAKAPEAAEALKITAQDLLPLGIIDEIVPEPLGGAHREYDTTAENLKTALMKNLSELKNIPAETLLSSRYEKFRKIGKFTFVKKQTDS